MKLLFCFSACFIFSFSFAQSIAPEVISTSGNSFNSGASQLDWTLGESATATFNAGSDMLTQGFHQPNLIITSISDIQTDYSVNIFPNPSTDLIHLEFKNTKGDLVIQLFAIDGKLLESRRTETSSPLEIMMTKYEAGTYILSIKDDQSKVRSYRIVKTH
jgi:membrane-bound inhibitor of C-type lysozyme